MRYILLACLCCWSLWAYSQQPVKKEEEEESIKYSSDTVMQRLDHAHLLLNRINTSMDGEFNTRKIEQRLPAISNILEIINNSTYYMKAIPEFKNLQLFGVMLDDIGGQLGAWRSSLFKYTNELANTNIALLSLVRDTAILQLKNDSLYMEIYQQELRALRQKWELASRSTQVNIIRIKALQLTVSKQYFLTVDLQSQVGYVKRQLGEQLFRNEYGYLWATSGSQEPEANAHDLAVRSLMSEGPLIAYFLDRSQDNYIYILIVGAAFFWWVRRTVRDATDLSGFTARGLSVPTPEVRPFLYTLIVILNIHPLFELHGSTFPVSQLPLLLVLGILFRQKWSPRQFAYWVTIALLFILFLGTRAVLTQISARISLLLLNIISLTLGYYSIRQLTGNFLFNKLLKLALWIFVVLNVLALPANIYGRLSLARIFSNTAIFGVVQAIGLSVFSECVQECLRLRSATGRTKEYSKVRTRLFEQLEVNSVRALRFFGLVIWIFSFAINLNIYDYLGQQWKQLLDHSFRVGSISFQLGNLLLLFLILFISNLLQKYIGLIYSAVDDRNLAQSGKRGSRLAMLRLFIIIAGFLLAIGASGIPLDKITIILGALGVGIGLGLQSVVNNLVSGIILIFERPFQIGDFIELNNKKGIVRDIGIRSSKIVTEEGTEIIMPNGDLLSGQVINWTVRNKRVRIEIPLTIEAGRTFQEIEYTVQEALAHLQGLSEENAPRVLINTATEKTTSITILAWISNIGHIQTIKSEILSLLYQHFKEKGMRVV